MQIKWDDRFKTNNGIIDTQHQELFRLCEELHSLHNNEFIIDKYDKIVDAIEALKAYTVYHFTAEERYMTGIGYRHIDTHKEQHQSFISKLDAIDYNRLDYDQDSYLLELLTFVIEWITEHILTEDKNIDNIAQ
jgi:hemerythrin